MIKHIQFLSTKENVCEHPEKLGTDFVVPEVLLYSEDIGCRDCLNLLTEYNKNEYNDDVLFGVETLHHKVDNARGLVYGLIAGSALWALILSLFWFIFIR